MVDVIFAWFVRNRNRIVKAFYIVYSLLFVFFILSGVSVFVDPRKWGSYYELARVSGKCAVLVYIASCIPGISRRFGLSHKLLSILMMFRRYVGILVCMLLLIHTGILKFVPWISGLISLIPLENFEVFGGVAFILLFFLFITSNDVSIRALGIWWDRIHDLTYVIVWFIALHIVLQRFSLWSILITLLGILQVASHVYARKKRSV